MSLRLTTTTCVYVVVVVLATFFSFESVSKAQENQSQIITEEAPLGQDLAVEQTEQIVVEAPLGYSIEEINVAPGAPNPNDFVVGPGKTELTIKPGETRVAEIIVTNRIGTTRDFKFEVEDTTGSDNPNTPIVLLGNEHGPYTLKDYVTLPKTTITLENNQRARIPVTITIPADAEPGGRYGSILVTTVSKDVGVNTNGGAAPSSVIVSRLATLFFITIPGDTEINAELKGISTVPEKLFFTEAPINFQILFENKGDLHLTPYGELRVHNFVGEEVGFVELDPWFAMPKSLRAREVEWNRELLIGRYTVTAQINRGYDDIVDEASVSFWVIPWRVLGGIFAILFVFFLTIRFIARNVEFKVKKK